MLKLDLTTLGKISNDHGLTTEEIKATATSLSDYLQKIHARDQGFYSILDDQETVTRIKAFAQENASRYEHFVVLGIGGSSLGTICLQQSLTHLFKAPKLHVLDNIDPAFLKELDDVIDYQKTLFIVVTKSGGTPEILSQYYYFRKNIEDHGLMPKDHLVFVTDPQNGHLREVANLEGIPAFDIQQNVGGRFSVLTPVGLLPAALIGLDIDSLLDGARSMRDKFLSENFDDNLPFQLAAIQYLLEQKGKTINVIMPYSQRLIRLADWYRQLLAESIGKKLNDQGQEVYTGITPVNALGVTDQHSQSQLYNDGPNDKLILFIEVQDLGPQLPIPQNPITYLEGVSFNKLMNTEKKATEESLTENDRPNITIQIDKVSAETLGELFLLFEGATAFLGEFYGINAFDQPGVERSKVLTKELLERS